jgi:hypothetical protein
LIAETPEEDDNEELVEKYREERKEELDVTRITHETIINNPIQEVDSSFEDASFEQLVDRN